MTTQYETKEQALDMGMYYAGYFNVDEGKKVLAEATIDTIVLDWPHSFPATDGHAGFEKRLETYEVPNKNGVKIRLGVSAFREGYDLWLIAPNGIAQRT